jgi:ribosomal protein L29
MTTIEQITPSNADSHLQDKNFFSLRSNNHLPQTDSNQQLEKLKKEIAKVKRHNSKSRSQSRNINGIPALPLKQVPTNLKNEIIMKYKARPDSQLLSNGVTLYSLSLSFSST